ncbi:MAG: sulfite exporter TauE/SafE family protein [Candidatus Bathyarchaeia archaeon]
MYPIILAGFSLGVGVALPCTAVCYPVVATHILADRPRAKEGFYTTILFTLGRLVSYLTLGVVSAFLGRIILGETQLAQKLLAPTLFTLGAVLALYGLSIWFGFRIRIGPKVCSYFGMSRSTIGLGILAGFRPCLPLLAALTYTTTLGNVAEGVFFMTSFWLGSVVYMPALGLATGAAASLGVKRMGMERIRRISGIALLIVGFLFMSQGSSLYSSLGLVDVEKGIERFIPRNP